VIALEALDRKTGGTEPSSAAEIRRLKQTPTSTAAPILPPRQQEEMAAKLRVANSPRARGPQPARRHGGAGSRASRDEVRAQQAFVDEHCTSPIR